MFSFFEFLSEKSSSNLAIKNNFKAITTDNSSWPNFIFNVDLNQDSLTEISSAITENQHLNHIILDENQVNKYENILTEKGFFPLAEWTCLEFGQNQNNNEIQNKLEIKKTTLENLKQWTDVASSGFGILNHELFESCFNSHQIEFYSGYYQNKMVATALLFYHNKTAGIYHVVTLPEERSKGFGSEIFSYCEGEAIENGAEQVIAQSTTDGLNAWKNTGMKMVGNFYLFCWNKPKQ